MAEWMRAAALSLALVLTLGGALAKEAAPAAECTMGQNDIHSQWFTAKPTCTACPIRA